jgi:sterol desaturase/sphingolipid hydroxylase (fatty acid hydroxylase superfamily)
MPVVAELIDQMWAVSAFVEQRALAQWRVFLGFESRLSAAQLLLSALIAAGAWKLSAGSSTRFRLSAFLRYLFPRSAYLSRSSGVDVKIFVSSALFSPARRLMFGVSVAAGASMVLSVLESNFGRPLHLEAGWAGVIPAAILVLLISDFSTYLIHRLSHEWQPLWAFHRVHHSATSMTPLTLMRKHPVFDMAGNALRVLMLAPLWGAILFIWKPAAAPLVVMVVTVGNGLFSTFAGNLRHSHVWISYGPWLERIFVSPAMHQIHHSKAPEHWDRNYGEIFAFWDLVFGTIHLSGPFQALSFGLAEGDVHKSWRAAMLEPFAYFGRSLKIPELLNLPPAWPKELTSRTSAAKIFQPHEGENECVTP